MRSDKVSRAADAGDEWGTIDGLIRGGHRRARSAGKGSRESEEVSGDKGKVEGHGMV